VSIPPSADHFQGKTVPEHLKEARQKGAMAAAEVHGTEMPGHLAALADASRDTVFALLIFWIATGSFTLMLLFACGWLIWKTGRSAFVGWARLERLHRLIEEERWEIEHHRGQEREELAELYRAKGFTGKLLDEVVDVLMADDDRLLRVMLEEELGLTLEAYEHPLKQCLGAALGVVGSALVLLLSFKLNASYGLPFSAALILIGASALGAVLERNRAVNAVIWNLGLAILTCGTVYFLKELF
jgi:hypothetical protein